MFTLSLLSRGKGQVVQNKQKRLEVYLEPEDYLNLTPQGKAPISRSQDETQTMQGSLPKTYSTRKGVLILYSEDFAEPSWKQKESKKSSRPQLHQHRKKKLGFAFHTLKDLRTAILAYGRERKDQKDQGWQPYLHFLSKTDSETEQQIRPGYSAKRYLLSLFQTWTPGTLYKLQCSGCIRDPRLFQDNQLYLPDHIRKQQDLSAVPSKYHLLPVYPSVSPFWTQKEQRDDKDEWDLDCEESEDSDIEKKDYGVEKHWWKRVPLPPLRQKPSGKVFWLDDDVLEEDTWMEAYQRVQDSKESQEHCEKSQPPLGSDSVFANIDTSQLLRQKSHSTFYGGTFPERKTFLSGNVKTSKGRYQLFPELPYERCVLPPVQPTISPHQNVHREGKIKQVPKILKLPPIAEEPLLRAQDHLKGHLNDYGTPEELLILPMGVHLFTEHQLKERGQREGPWHTGSRPKVNREERYLPRLSLRHASISQPPLTVHLPRESKRDSPLITDHNFSQQDAITHEKGGSGIKSNRFQQKTPGTSSLKDLMGDRSSQDGLPGELKGSSQDPALGNILMGPAGDNACQLLLDSVQRRDLPLHLDFASGEACQSVDSITDVGEECSNDQHVRKGNIDSETSLHVNACETSSFSPGPTMKNMSNSVTPEGLSLTKGASQSLEAAVLKTGESQTFINKELENKKRQKCQRRKSKIITEDLLHDLGNGGQGMKVTIQTEELYSDSDVFSEDERPTQDGWDPLYLDSQTRSLSVKETMKFMPQVYSSSTKEAEKQNNGTFRSLATSRLEQSPTPWADVIKELGGDNELPYCLTRSPGNVPVPSKRVETKSNRSEKQPPSRRRKGKDVSPKLGKLAEDSINPERQMPEKNKGWKRKGGNRSKAPYVHKTEKLLSRTEFVEGRPKKQKVEKKTLNSKKKKSRTKRKEMGQKNKGNLEMGLELSNTSPEESSDEEGSYSGYSSEEFRLPPKYDIPESQVSRDERASSSIQPIIVTENKCSEEEKSPDTSEAIPVIQQQEKVSRERLLAERAEKRLQEVERRRRLKEEQKRQLQEEQMRVEKIKEELEQEQQKRAEERRLQRQKMEEERLQKEEEERRKLQQEQAAQVRARQKQEELRRKLQEMQRKRQEEEARRAEAEKQRQKELERQIAEEQQRLMEMAEEERVEYQRRKEEEEERARQEAEAKRQKEEEEARLALEKAKKQADQLGREKATLAAHQRFSQELLKEGNELKQIQSISRPWVYSYFQLLQIPGSEAVTKEN